VRYEEFWKLTPISLSDIVAANLEKLKEDMQIKDICNWQLGQYFYLAQLDALANAFGKNGHNYPKEPKFSNALKEDKENKLSEKQEELETMKFKNFFSNLGNYVAIKKNKGENNGK
jgi:hypothetical protein